jgi:transposase-like protein
MARKVSKETVQLWRERMAHQAASGVSIRQFCDQEGIPQATFYAWRLRLRERTATPSNPVATRRTTPGQDKTESRRAGHFIPLRLLDTPTAWEVVHPRGYRVRVSGEVSATTLQCIVGVLDGRTHE